METTAIFSISSVGDVTGKSYNGSFKVKTVTTQRDLFRIDEVRRQLLGLNPNGASPAIQQDAIILAQLAVKIVEAPKWWQESDNGQDIEDANITGEIYSLLIKAENDRREKLQGEVKSALERLSDKEESPKKTKKG
jgi:hypothetical protein